jgi:glycerophosphoryl diester phosphodiesterase
MPGLTTVSAGHFILYLCIFSKPLLNLKTIDTDKRFMLKCRASVLTDKYLIMRLINYFKFLIVLLFFTQQAQSQHYINVKSTEELHELFRWTPDRIPLVSAHRGGPAAGYPENAVETFENTLKQTYALIECDPQLTKDSVAVMMHDYKLDRTTNGTGRLSDYTYAELMQLRLKDNEGNLTDFKIPTLDEVIKWAKNKTVLTVDIKRTISPEVIEKIIRENNAEAYAVVITYNLETAKRYYELNPKLMISVTVRNKEEYDRLIATGIPFENVIAFTGISEPDTSVYQMLHRQGVYCILGTMGNLDKSHAARQGNVYAGLVQKGADILATDFPVEAAQAIEEVVPAKSSKREFFVVKSKSKRTAAQKQREPVKRERERERKTAPAERTE